jgi:hypothetical protein
VLEQGAADERPDGGTDGKAGAPDADGLCALGFIFEHRPQQRQGRGCQGRAGQAEQGTGGDQHPGAGRERRGSRGGAEGGSADEQHLAPADAIAEVADRDQRAGQHEAVDVDDPQQLRAAGLQRRAEVRHGERTVRSMTVIMHGRARTARPRQARRAAWCVLIPERRMAPGGIDGTEGEIGPGDVMVAAPGHDAWVVGDEPCVFVDFGASVGQYAKPS